MREWRGERGGRRQEEKQSSGQDKRAETQGYFYRLTVVSEETAVRFHFCRRSRRAAAATAPPAAAPRRYRAGKRTRAAPPALCSTDPPPVSSLRSLLLLPSGWKSPLALWLLIYFPPASLTAPLAPAPRLGPSARSPSAGLVRAPPRKPGGSAAGPAPCWCRSFTALPLFLFLAYFHAAPFRQRLPDRRGELWMCPPWSPNQRKGLKQMIRVKV